MPLPVSVSVSACACASPGTLHVANFMLGARLSCCINKLPAEEQREEPQEEQQQSQVSTFHNIYNKHATAQGEREEEQPGRRSSWRRRIHCQAESGLCSAAITELLHSCWQHLAQLVA